MSQNIRLEIDTLKILKKREKWNLYFMIVAEMPTDPSKMAMKVLPQDNLIKLTRFTDNAYSFVPKGPNPQGLFALERAMPGDQSISCRLYLMQSRKAARTTGDIMSDITDSVEKSGAIGEVVETLGKGAQWVSVAGLAAKGIGGIGSILQNLKDRDLGFLSIDEDFKDNTLVKIPRSNNLSTGFAEISWTWVVQH